MSEVEGSAVDRGDQEEVMQVPTIEEEYSEPQRKKMKKDDVNTKRDNKLEDRLAGILCCTVCLDLPKTCFQCSNGHLMCAGCFNHLLADARLKNETATCPNCRCEITKTGCCRNLAVEKAVSELPCICRHCSTSLPRSVIQRHEADECQERPCGCKYARIGCVWMGPYHEVGTHQGACSHPHLSGEEIMTSLCEKHDVLDVKMNRMQTVFDLLSYEKISFNDIQLRPYRTDDYITKLYYESSRFSAFNLQWVIKARVVTSHYDPSMSCDRSLEFQICLKSRLSSPTKLHFIALSGPFCSIPMNSVIYDFDFTNDNQDTLYYMLPISDSVECNKVLAAKTINLRFVMFHA